MLLNTVNRTYLKFFRNALIFIGMAFVILSLKSSNGENSNIFDELSNQFSWIEEDTLCISPDRFLKQDGQNWEGTTIRKADWIKIGLDLSDRIALGRVRMDKNLTAYLLGTPGSFDIHTIVYSSSWNQVFFGQRLATYEFLDGAYELNMKSWIFDADLDGDMDIGTEKDLRDFEFPTEDAPNISSTTQYINYLEGHRFVYDFWEGIE